MEFWKQLLEHPWNALAMFALGVFAMICVGPPHRVRLTNPDGSDVQHNLRGRLIALTTIGILVGIGIIWGLVAWTGLVLDWVALLIGFIVAGLLREKFVAAAWVGKLGTTCLRVRSFYESEDPKGRDYSSRLDDKAESNAFQNPACLDLPSAAVLANLAQLAYQSPDQIDAGVARMGFDANAEILEKGGHLRCVIIRQGTLALIAFRGTQERKDWESNARVDPVKGPWGTRVHSGFLNATDAFWSDISRRLDEWGDDVGVWLTGHSLGGAIAMLFAARLCDERNLKPAGVYTFGQPAVGSVNFVKTYDNELADRTQRFVNFHDPVPNLPPGYFHTKKIQYFAAKGELRRDAQSKGGIWDDARAQYRLVIDWHSMEEYLMHTERALIATSAESRPD